MLGKYRLHWARLDASKFEPFVEVGPSFRSTGNLNANPSHYGVAAGVGVDTYWKGFDIAPVLRYTRWAHDPNEYGAAESKSDQLELLVAISWRPHTNSSTSGLARSSTGLLPGSRFSMRLITGTNLVGDYPTNSGPTTANQLVPVPGGGYTLQQIPATRYQSGWKRTCLLLDRSSRHGGVGFVPASDAGDARRGSALALRMQPGIRFAHHASRRCRSRRTGQRCRRRAARRAPKARRRFTNAGHLPPLWYHAAEQKWTLMIESTPYSKEIADLPLGMIPGTPYTQTAVQIGAGDLIVLYTDGVTDSTDDSGAHLDQNGLLALARRVPPAPASQTGQRLIELLDAFRGAVPPNDDETVVVLERVTAS